MANPNRVAVNWAVRRFTKMTLQTISVAESGPWRAASPSEAAPWLASLTVPWWIAGGWALDVFAGNQTRPHKDLDVGILRKDALQALGFLAGWEVFEAKDGVLTRLRAGMRPRPDVFSLWCRPAHNSDWAMELMLDEAENEHWIYRRQRQIQRPLSIAIRRSLQGIPYLAPEIQLLYKSHRIRRQDQADFEHIVPILGQGSRQWLRDSLRVTEPAHSWLSAL